MENDPCIREAELWSAAEGGKVRCGLCAHGCVVATGARGLCGVRENRGGVLDTLVYGRLVAERPDPIEKKPLYHFLPATISHSIATVGCNMRCHHCQNYTISQAGHGGGPLPGEYSSPEELVYRAIRSGASSISYTYSEPTIFFEYALDVMRLAHEKGLANIFVTNGFMTVEALKMMEGLLDAANIDLKSFEDGFYRKICGARAEPVLHSIAEMKSMGVWVEVTTLVIPGLNDSGENLRDIARFLVSTDEAIPWHVTGFFPTFKLTDVEPTPVSTLNNARKIGIAEGLKFVYAGNRPGSGGENTHCPVCKAAVVTRHGFTVKEVKLDEEGRCLACGETIPGRFGGDHGL